MAPCLCWVPQNKRPSEAPSPGFPQLPKSVKCFCEKPRKWGAPSSGKRMNFPLIPPQLAGVFHTVFNPHSNQAESPFDGCGRNLKSLGNVTKVTAGQQQSQDWAGSVCIESPVLSHPPGPLFQKVLYRAQRKVLSFLTSQHLSPPSLNRPMVGSAFLDQARPSPAAGPCCGWSALGSRPLEPLQDSSISPSSPPSLGSEGRGGRSQG